MSHDAQTSYRPDIDGLRAVAVLSVIGFHIFPGWIKGGFVGVDVFFVISGFLISRLIIQGLKSGRFSLAHFYARRIKRIFPGLILVFTACLIVGWLVLLADDYKRLGYHTVAGAAFVSNFAFRFEAGYFDSAAELKPLLHLWSLGIEEQFYVIWPILLYLSTRSRLNLSWLIVFVALASFVSNVQGIRTEAAATFYLPHTRVWELMIGGLLAHIELNQPLTGFQSNTSWKDNLKAYVGILLIAASIFGLSRDKVFPGWWALFPTFGTLLVISAGEGAWINRVLSSRALVFIGLISYPLYLWHWPLLAFTRLIESESPSRGIRIAIVFVSILFAWLTYKFVERPIRTKRTFAAPALLVGLVVFIASGGYYIYIHDGLPHRLPEVIQRITTHANDDRSAYREGRCLLMPEQDETSFARECTENKTSNGQLVFLWGDSHAAHLYPGLKALQGTTAFRIAQYTASACPPITDQSFSERPYCRGINTSVLAKIRKEKPSVVLLAASWNIYDLSTLNIANTIRLLHEAGVAKIAVVGPVPQWRNGLPRSLGTYLIRSNVDRVPARIKQGVNLYIWDTENKLRQAIAGLDVIYISALAAMCDENGCLVRIDGESEDLTTWDESHLTESGSIFLTREIFRKLNM